MRRALLAHATAAATLLTCGTAAAGEFEIHGFGLARGVDATGQPSWLTAGFGRLAEGAASPGDTASAFRSQIQIGLDWRPSPIVLVHAHGLAREEGARDRGDRAGLTEAFVQIRPELSPRTALRLRAGLFFPPTSRENADPLWSSPYTLTLSALNTWIAEELRLTGIEGALVRKTAAGELQIAGTVFGASDTSGALLAWRGFTMSDRLTVVGERLPVPPLSSLLPGQGFARQDPLTQPIDEIDHHAGWQARARWQQSGVFVLQAAYLDNGGDRELYRGQYSWHTRFAQTGGEWRITPGLVLVAEGALGDTGMGAAGGAHVDVRFRVGYGLLSWGNDRARVSARYDRFRNDDRDGTAEPDGESGSAWTVAAFWKPNPHVRVGVEWLDLRAQRPAAAFSGANPDTNARTLTGELRLGF